MKKEIKELVAFALSDELNNHKAITIGSVNKKGNKIMIETMYKKKKSNRK